MPQRRFELSATVDFPDDCAQHVFTPSMLDALMGILADMGVSRVNWLYYGSVDEGLFWSEPAPFGNRTWVETVRQLGEPMAAAVPLAHRHGMRLYAVIKPYNTGISGSTPTGQTDAERSDGLDRLGGPMTSSVPFVRRNPHLRIARRLGSRPEDLATIPIIRLRLLKQDSSPTRVAPKNLQIWTSNTNSRYTRRDLTFTVRESVEPGAQSVTDYDGNTVTAAGNPVRVLTLDGLHLTDRYVLITTDFRDREGDFRNTPLAMVEAHGPSGPLPISVATAYTIGDGPRDFRTGGLEFDTGLGTMPTTLDVDNTPVSGDRFPFLKTQGVIGLARGRNRYLPTALSEGYAEVHALWLGWVDECLASGVDGIDLRMSAHSTLTDHPEDYGFNPPIVAAYRRRYGIDIDTDPVDLAALAAVRGELFTPFVRAARLRAESAGKPLLIHLHTEAFRPSPPPGAIMGFPANLLFDWRGWLDDGLVDAVTLRTSWFESYEPGSARRLGQPAWTLDRALTDPVVEDAIRTVRTHGLPLYLTRYVLATGSPDLYAREIEATARDGRFDGFDVYESKHITLIDNGQVLPKREWTDAIGRVFAKVGPLPDQR